GSLTVTRFAYEGSRVWAELNGASQVTARYLRGDAVDQVFARVAADGTASWYLPDRLGSVRDVTDSSGAVLDHLGYDAFGRGGDRVLRHAERGPDAHARPRLAGHDPGLEPGQQYPFRRVPRGGAEQLRQRPVRGPAGVQHLGGPAAADPRLVSQLDGGLPTAA